MLVSKELWYRESEQTNRRLQELKKRIFIPEGPGMKSMDWGAVNEYWQEWYRTGHETLPDLPYWFWTKVSPALWPEYQVYKLVESYPGMQVVDNDLRTLSLPDVLHLISQEFYQVRGDPRDDKVGATEEGNPIYIGEVQLNSTDTHLVIRQTLNLFDPPGIHGYHIYYIKAPKEDHGKLKEWARELGTVKVES